MGRTGRGAADPSPLVSSETRVTLWRGCSNQGRYMVGLRLRRSKHSLARLHRRLPAHAEALARRVATVVQRELRRAGPRPVVVVAFSGGAFPGPGTLMPGTTNRPRHS